MDKIIILCPGDVISGGVNSLHNLCASLTRNGFNAAMYYFNAKPEIINSHQITSYNVNSHDGKLDEPGHIIFVSESMTERVASFSKAIKVVYWLGIKFYFKSPLWKPPFNKKIFRRLIKCRSYYGYSSGLIESAKRKLNEFAKSEIDIWTDDFIHISNSHYVANYCLHKGAKNVHVLHNPIRDEFYEKDFGLKKRTKTILFGPKTPKLLVFFLRLFLKDYKIIQLRHLPFEQVVKLMSESVVFAEFGSNHGRDRMPREAAMLGCIVFMNTRGSSALNKDYKIDDQYKIIDKLINYPRIIKEIKKAAKNYENQISDFGQFRDQLKNERANFDWEVNNVFQRITDNFNKA
ncbi:MAG: hypothetical protein ABFS35_04660 [Bacteroidota bacterium]